jgi:hypothetical protein
MLSGADWHWINGSKHWKLIVNGRMVGVWPKGAKGRTVGADQRVNFAMPQREAEVHQHRRAVALLQSGDVQEMSCVGHDEPYLITRSTAVV